MQGVAGVRAGGGRVASTAVPGCHRAPSSIPCLPCAALLSCGAGRPPAPSAPQANHKYLTNITVPASFIKRSDGDVLKGLLKSGQQVTARRCLRQGGPWQRRARRVQEQAGLRAGRKEQSQPVGAPSRPCWRRVPWPQVYVTLDWTDALPKKQQVSWEFWTNSNDQCGPICDVQKEFIKDFVPVAKVGGRVGGPERMRDGHLER